MSSAETTGIIVALYAAICADHATAAAAIPRAYRHGIWYATAPKLRDRVPRGVDAVEIVTDDAQRAFGAATYEARTLPGAEVMSDFPSGMLVQTPSHEIHVMHVVDNLRNCGKSGRVTISCHAL